MKADDPVPKKRIQGKREMKELALETVAALESADLHDQLEELQQRVLTRDPETLFESVRIDDNVWQWTFKPIVELLFYHVLHAARATSLAKEEQRRQIQWALRISGF
jgi:hypothetical protein